MIKFGALLASSLLLVGIIASCGTGNHDGKSSSPLHVFDSSMASCEASSVNKNVTKGAAMIDGKYKVKITKVDSDPDTQGLRITYTVKNDSGEDKKGENLVQPIFYFVKDLGKAHYIEGWEQWSDGRSYDGEYYDQNGDTKINSKGGWSTDTVKAGETKTFEATLDSNDIAMETGDGNKVYDPEVVIGGKTPINPNGLSGFSDEGKYKLDESITKPFVDQFYDKDNPTICVKAKVPSSLKTDIQQNGIRRED